jgi:hypothetical protein
LSNGAWTSGSDLEGSRKIRRFYERESGDRKLSPCKGTLCKLDTGGIMIADLSRLAGHPHKVPLPDSLGVFGVAASRTALAVWS